MKQQKFLTLLALAALMALPACTSVKKELGVGRNSPDEFMVVKRAPLTLPPDYDLRPPSDDSAPPATDASNQAKAALIGTQDDEAAPKGNAENALLAKMGTDKANPDIRNIINKENGYIALQNRTLADKLIFWQDTPADPNKGPSSVVNAKEEAERIKKNQEEGKPANTGDVPVIEKKPSTIDKIF